MTRSERRSTTATLKEKKSKVFYEHSKDSFELAVSIGKIQEDKALLKTEKHHQHQAGQPRSERMHQSKKKKKLEEVKAAIATHQAQLKREKVKLRKQRPVRAVHQKSRPSNDAQDDEPPPLKRVSFA